MDFEGMILAHQEALEIFEDDPEGAYNLGGVQPLMCCECSDKGHCPEYEPDGICVDYRNR